MKLLHRIGPRLNSNFNEIQEILSEPGPISFDGVYDSVLWHSDQLIGKDITLFVMGDYVGSDNAFDLGQPKANYLTWGEIAYLSEKLGAHVGFHSWSHRDLTKLSDEEVRKEIKPPFPMTRFAYPYGRVDERVARLVKEAGYTDAWAAGPYGDGSQFQQRRSYINW